MYMYIYTCALVCELFNAELEVRGLLGGGGRPEGHSVPLCHATS